jgi:hypothetical protein
MKLLKGETITGSILDSTTVPEAVVTAWSDVTTYAIGNRAGSAVVDGAAQYVYESKTAGNLNNALPSGETSNTHWRFLSVVYPAYNVGVTYDIDDIVTDLTNHRLKKSLANSNTGNPLTDETKWEDIGPTNAWAMFTTVVQQQTTVTDGFEVELSPSGFVTGIGFLNLSASSIDVEILSGVDVVFSETYTLTEAPSESGFWWWLFEPLTKKTSLYIDNLPPILGVDITATFNGEGAVSCGIMSIGQSLDIGTTVYGVNYSIIDYSTTVEASNGAITISQGSYRDVVDVPVVVQNSAFNLVRGILNANKTTPAVWFIDDNYPLVYGFYDRYDLMAGNPAFSDLTIRIEGLI